MLADEAATGWLTRLKPLRTHTYWERTIDGMSVADRAGLPLLGLGEEDSKRRRPE